jgi:30S ribosomal protein S17
MEKAKQELVGKVVSAKNDKTITIAVVTYKKHPLYKKNVKTTKKYAVHDEENKASVGDTVKVVASAPISKTKRYVLDSIVEKAVIL